MSDHTADPTSARLIGPGAPPASGPVRRRVRTTARCGLVLTAATTMAGLAVATVGLAAPTEAATTPLLAARPAATPGSAMSAHGWSPTGSMITSRTGAATALLADGRVLATGGYDSGYQPLSSSELYDPTTGTWTATGSLLGPLVGATATTLKSGNVLLVGGGTAQTQLFNPTTGTWTARRSMPSSLVGIMAGRLPSGRVIVAGTGSIPSSPLLPSAVEYSPATNSWASLSTPPFPIRIGGGNIDGSAVLPHGQLFNHFGLYGSSVYKRASNTWKELKTTGMYLADHSQLALLPRGHVMVASGTDYSFVASIVPSTRVYDVNPTTGAAVALAGLPRDYVYLGPPSYDGSQLAQLGNGSILATGGDSAADLDHVYRPATDTWSTVPGRYSRNATLVTLANGSVLDTGGSVFTP